MSALRYRNLTRRLWWLLLLCIVPGLAGGLLGGLLFFPVYQATAQLQVDIRSTSPTASVALANDRVIRTLALDATSSSVLKVVAAKHAMSVSHLASEVTSVPLANTSALTITVQDSNPSRAAVLANDVSDEVVIVWRAVLNQQNAASQEAIRNAIADTATRIASISLDLKALGTPPNDPAKAASLQSELTTLHQQYQQQLTTLSNIQDAEATQTFMVSVVSRALPPGSPLFSRLAVDASAGGLFGALVGLILITGLGQTRRRLHSAEGVAETSGWPVLLEFERVKAMQRTPDGTVAAVDTLGAAATSLIRSIDFLSVDRPLHTIVLTSPSASSASSALCSALAIYLAATGRRTLLVDARFVSGSQARQFGVPSVPGLTDAVLAARSAPPGMLALDGYMYEPTRMHAPFLRVLPSGSVPPNPSRLLASRPCRVALSALKASGADMIVVDAPPLRSADQASVLAEVADGFLPVVDLADTSIQHLLSLQSSLADAGASVLGCIVHLNAPGDGVKAYGSRAEVSPTSAAGTGESTAGGLPHAASAPSAPSMYAPLTEGRQVTEGGSPTSFRH